MWTSLKIKPNIPHSIYCIVIFLVDGHAIDVHYLCSLAMIGKLSFLTHHLYVISPQLLVSKKCLFCTALLSL